MVPFDDIWTPVYRLPEYSTQPVVVLMPTFAWVLCCQDSFYPDDMVEHLFRGDYFAEHYHSDDVLYVNRGGVWKHMRKELSRVANGYTLEERWLRDHWFDCYWFNGSFSRELFGDDCDDDHDPSQSVLTSIDGPHYSLVQAKHQEQDTSTEANSECITTQLVCELGTTSSEATESVCGQGIRVEENPPAPLLATHRYNTARLPTDGDDLALGLDGPGYEDLPSVNKAVDDSALLLTDIVETGNGVKR